MNVVCSSRDWCFKGKKLSLSCLACEYLEAKHRYYFSGEGGSGDDNLELLSGFRVYIFLLFNYQKADDKIFVCKFAKIFKSKLYRIENSKTSGQTA